MKANLFLAMAVMLVVLVSQPVSQQARAQITSATISGVIKDSSAAVLPNVSVVISNQETGLKRSVATDDQGRYNARDLAVGSYEMAVSLTGFKEFVRKGITLVVGQNAVVNIQMELGDVSEQVVVTAEAPLIETTNAQLAGLVSSNQLRELPLNGRSFDQLALLQAGVQAFRQVLVTANTSFSTRMTVSGARIDANNIILDGIEINDWSRSGGGSAAGLFLGVDAVQEFKVLTHNYSSEFGRNAGAVINIVTRSGTNTMHGSVYEFLRNDRLDARNFFDAEKRTLRRNQFGGVVSGPIRTDKAFFVANYEGFRERRGSPFTNFVLTETARRGILPTGTITVAPQVMPYLSPNVMQLPNAGILPGGVTGRFLYQFKKPTQEDYGMGRLDYRINDNDSIYFRYTRDESSSVDPDLRGSTPSFNAAHDFTQHSGVFQYTRILSPSLINISRVGVKRAVPKSVPLAGSDFPEQALTFIPSQPFGRMEFSTTSNTFGAGASSALTPFGQASLTPGHWFTTGYQLNDHLVLTRGDHAIKFGFEYELIRDWINNGTVAGGSYTFTSIESFLAGQPARFTADLPSRDPSGDYYQHYLGWYVADDFKILPRLTLNLGLRHEFVTSPRDRRAGHTAAFLSLARDPDATLTPVLFNVTKNQFAPRVGLAWDVSGDGKTSIRSGFGLYHNLWLGRDYGIFVQPAPQYRGTLTIQPPARQPVFPNEFLVQQGLGFPISSSLPTGSHVQYDGVKTPTMLHYSLEVQRELFPTGMLRVGYVGSKGYSLLSNSLGNPRLPTILPDGRMFFAATTPLVNPRLNPITERSSEAASRYNSLQLDFRMRPTHGLEIQTVYVWSKSIDNLSSQAGADSRGAPTLFMNPFLHSIDKGLSDFDARQNFTLNYLYEVPSGERNSAVARAALRGWSLGGIISLAGGNPYTALTGFCRSNVTTNCGADRPNLAPGASNNPLIGDPTRYFDATAFTLQDAGTFGNAGRNTLIGPALVNFDFSVYKKFPVSETKSFQFRAEIFNLFNHPTFALPGGNLFTATGARQENAGVITRTTTTSREVQFALKFSF
ncbi:MAG: TonB-dependent receptor [Acidobacteria bacterium]|nr:TonB-dependent receptor [Acidobacteriota bacterium]